MISMRYCRVVVILCAIQASGCAMLDTQVPSKVSTVGLIATPPQNYSTPKARYLGTRYKENLDRLVERIVRNPKTSNLQFANNISSVGGIGFFTHSATKSPDERYLEVVMGTPETFEKQISRSEKLARILNLYGGELLAILSGDNDIFQDKELAGYGLNLAWRNVVAEPRGNRIVMERAIVYFLKERVREFVRRKLSQDALLSEAVIFAVEEDGPLQLVSYRPEELRADFRPPIREDILPSTTLPAKPDPIPAAPPASKIAKESLPEPAVKSPPAPEVPEAVKEAGVPPATKAAPAKEVQPAAKPKPAPLPKPEALAMERPLRPQTPKAPSLRETAEQARPIPTAPPLAQPKQAPFESPAGEKISPPAVLTKPRPESAAVKEPKTAAVEPAAPPPAELAPKIEPTAGELEVARAEQKPPLKVPEPAIAIAPPKKAAEPAPAVTLKPVEQARPPSVPPAMPQARLPETAPREQFPAAPPPAKSSVAPEPAEPILSPKAQTAPSEKIAAKVDAPTPVKEIAQPQAPAGDIAPPQSPVKPPAPPAASSEAVEEKNAAEQVALLPVKPAEPRPQVKPLIRPEPRALEGFVIQIAFRDREKARSWAEGMEKRGYAVSITEAGAEGALRVRLGNFAQRDEAERQLRSFKQEGLTGIVINLPQRFRPEARSSVP